jgi:hypothetical protein
MGNVKEELKYQIYGCETWYLTLREERRLRVFENRILRRIFGPTRDANGEWRRLYNEELHSLLRSPNIVRVIKSRRLRWAGHVARMDEGRSSINILTGTRTGMERNANHIIPLRCHLPVNCRSIVERCGSPGSCKPQI